MTEKGILPAILAGAAAPVNTHGRAGFPARLESLAYGIGVGVAEAERLADGCGAGGGAPDRRGRVITSREMFWSRLQQGRDP